MGNISNYFCKEKEEMSDLKNIIEKHNDNIRNILNRLKQLESNNNLQFTNLEYKFKEFEQHLSLYLDKISQK